MKSRTSEKFRKAFSKIPAPIKKQAREAYKIFQKDPYHSSLNFKRVHSSEPIYSIRVSLHYRALGAQANGEIIWFWIGSHADYDQLLKRL